MKRVIIVFFVVCLMLISCEDYRTKYVVIPVNSRMARVDDDFRDEIEYAKIVSIAKGIDRYGFRDCENLTEVTIEDGPTIIGEHAFERCEKLHWISIPKSINSIGAYAFHDCRNLDVIYYNGTKEEWEEISKDENWKDPERTCTIYYSYSYTISEVI